MAIKSSASLSARTDRRENSLLEATLADGAEGTLGFDRNHAASGVERT